MLSLCSPLFSSVLDEYRKGLFGMAAGYETHSRTGILTRIVLLGSEYYVPGLNLLNGVSIVSSNMRRYEYIDRCDHAEPRVAVS